MRTIFISKQVVDKVVLENISGSDDEMVTFEHVQQIEWQ